MSATAAREWSLSGQTCTQSQPADCLGLYRPSGFSLSGTHCTQALTQAASVSGYLCPADWLRGTTLRTLRNGDPGLFLSCWIRAGNASCTSASTYAATPNYSCPADYTISVRRATKPRRRWRQSATLAQMVILSREATAIRPHPIPRPPRMFALPHIRWRNDVLVELELWCNCELLVR